MLSLVIAWWAKTTTINRGARYRDPSRLTFLDRLEPRVPLFFESLKFLPWRLDPNHRNTTTIGEESSECPNIVKGSLSFMCRAETAYRLAQRRMNLLQYHDNGMLLKYTFFTTSLY